MLIKTLRPATQTLRVQGLFFTGRRAGEPQAFSRRRHSGELLFPFWNIACAHLTRINNLSHLTRFNVLSLLGVLPVPLAFSTASLFEFTGISLLGCSELCHIVIDCAVLCHTMFHGYIMPLLCALLCFTTLYCVSLCCIELYCVLLCYIVLYCFSLCYIVLYCVSLCCIVLCCISPCCTVFHCVVRCTWWLCCIGSLIILLYLAFYSSNTFLGKGSF